MTSRYRKSSEKHLWPSQKNPGKNVQKQGNNVLIYGFHAVREAVKNPKRDHKKLWLTKNMHDKLADLLVHGNPKTEIVDQKTIGKRLGGEAVHQGVLLETTPLPEGELSSVYPDGPVLVLDQVTDPHNVGAILRSASVFGASALLMTERNSPPLSGPLAKAASGGLEHVPVILKKNLARALEELADIGYWRVGLDGEADQTLETLENNNPVALVLGAEGKGLRRLTRENCDILCRIPGHGALRSLNVSNAAAVSLYCIQSRSGQKTK